MDSIIGRKYNTLRLSGSVMAEGYGNLGPTIDKNTPHKGGKITMTQVDLGVLVTFDKKGVPDFFISQSMVQSGSFLAKEPTSDKAVVVSKPAPPAPAGNPWAAGVPGNSGGGMGQPTGGSAGPTVTLGFKK